jgi:transposase-like protein
VVLASKSNIQWSDQDRAAAYVLWVSNDKNVRKTSRECGIPTNTLRYWVKGWNESGPPDAVLDEIPAQMYEFVHHANRVRQNAMDKLEELIPQAEVKQLSAIATVVGIMDDKIRLASGLATKRTETVQILPSREDMKELMGGFVDGLVGAAESRAGEIIDVEVEEQPESSGLLVLKG